jgi:hypothetical protein
MRTYQLKARYMWAVILLGTAAGVAGWTCFTDCNPLSYNPIPLCYAGTNTPPPDPNKGWQCYKYWINDTDYGFSCIPGDGQTAAQIEYVAVSVTEWGGWCTSTNCCAGDKVLHYRETWTNNYCHRMSPCPPG